MEVGRIAGQNDNAPGRIRLHFIAVELIAQAVDGFTFEAGPSMTQRSGLGRSAAVSAYGKYVFGGLEGLHPTDPTHALRGSGRTLHDAPDHHGRNAREHGLGLRRRQYTAKNVPELTGLLM